MTYTRIGRGYERYGSGLYLPTAPQQESMSHNSFEGGLDFRQAKEDAPRNTSPDAMDVEITLNDRLRPAPGTTTLETFSGRDPVQMILHPSLDFTTELVFFDPPYIGVRRTGATVWTDVGLPASSDPFAYTVFGDVLVFSNGVSSVYSRQPNATTVESVSGPPSLAYETFATRVFAGGAILDGSFEPRGVRWSSSGSYADWDEDDSELLIDNVASSDYIVAMKSMGLDFMAIFMRHSIWIARRSGVALRPAEFQPRVLGLGCVSAKTVKATRFGVPFLSDTGVHLFDGNSAPNISEQINPELLPLDSSQFTRYSALYNPVTAFYYLFTPTDTWVCDLERRRWHRRSLVALDGVPFSTQYSAITWGELVGTWGAQTGTWQDLRPAESEDLRMHFLASPSGARSIVEEDYGSREMLGVQMAPRWELPRTQGQYANQLITTQRLVVSHEGSGEIEVDLPDNDGDLAAARSVPLRGSTDVDEGNLIFTGKGLGGQIRFVYGSPEVRRLDVAFIQRAKRIEVGATAVVLLTDEGIVVSGYYTDFSNYVTGALPSGWAKGDDSTMGWLVVADPLATGGKVLRGQLLANQGSGIHGSLLWTQAPAAADMEVGGFWRYSNSGTTLSQYLARVRSSIVAAFTSHFLGIVAISGDRQIGRQTTASTFTGAQNVAVSVPPANTFFGFRLRGETSGASARVRAKFWQKTAAADFGEPASWLLDNTMVAAPSPGRPGVGCRWQQAADFADFDVFGLSYGGTAPLVPPVTGWNPEPGKINIRITGLPTGFKARVGATIVTETDGVAVLTLATLPASIDILRADSTLLGTWAGAIADLKSYAFSYTYV